MVLQNLPSGDRPGGESKKDSRKIGFLNAGGEFYFTRRQTNFEMPWAFTRDMQKEPKRVWHYRPLPCLVLGTLIIYERNTDKNPLWSTEMM